MFFFKIDVPLIGSQVIESIAVIGKIEITYTKDNHTC